MSETGLVPFAEQGLVAIGLKDLQALGERAVQDAADEKQFIDGLGVLKKFLDDLEARRTTLKAPYLEAGRKIDAEAKQILETVSPVEKRLRQRVQEWRSAEAERIRLEQERIRSENEAKQRALEAEQAALEKETLEKAREAGFAEKEAEELAHLEVADIPAPVLEAAPVQVPTVKTETAAATIKKVWNFQVLDPSLVPREYTVVNETAIRAAVRAGVREIPGVRIFEEDQLSVRPR